MKLSTLLEANTLSPKLKKQSILLMQMQDDLINELDCKVIYEKNDENDFKGFWFVFTNINNVDSSTILRYQYCIKTSKIDAGFIVDDGQDFDDKVEPPEVVSLPELIEHIKASIACIQLNELHGKEFARVPYPGEDEDTRPVTLDDAQKSIIVNGMKKFGFTLESDENDNSFQLRKDEIILTFENPRPSTLRSMPANKYDFGIDGL